MKNFLILIMIFFTLTNLWADHDHVHLSKEELAYLKNKKVLKINTKTTWRPYSYIENNEIKGFTNDFLKLLTEHLPIKVEFITQSPWNESLRLLKENKIDIIPNIVKTKEREDYFSFTDENTFNVKASIVSQNNYKTISQLENKKVAVVKGSVFEKIFKEKYPNIELITKSFTVDLIKALINKEVDAALDDYVVLNTNLNNLALNVRLQNNILFNKYFELPLKIAVNKDEKLLLSILNKAFKNIEKNEYIHLLDKWGIFYETENGDFVPLSEKEEELLEKAKMNIYVTNWEPFTIHGDTVEGICADIWELVVKKSHIKYNYIKDANFAEALRLIKADPNGMIIATSSTKDREVYGAFTKPFITFPIAVATAVDKDFIIDFKELEGKTVAVGKNYTAHVKLKEAYPGIKFVPVKDTIEALNLLANGKVYAATDILPSLIYNMNKYNFSNLKVSGTSKLNFDVKFMVNKHNKDLIPILNRYIDSLKDEDKQKILNKWIFTKEITRVDYTAAYAIVILSLVVIGFMFVRQKILKDKEQFIANERYKYKSILDLASDSVHIIDQNGDLVEYSKSFADMLGFDYEETAKLNVKDWDVHFKKDEIDEFRRSIIFEKKAVTFETRHKRKDGVILDVQISAIGIEIDNKHYLYASARDITQEKKNKKIMSDQKQEFESIFNYSKDGIAILDSDTKFLKFNDAFIQMTGYEKEELLDKTTLDFTVPEDIESTKDIIKQIYKDGKAIIYEKIFIFKDNNRVTVNISLSLLPDKQRLLIVAKDVTSLKQLEDQSRLAAMGEMIGNIAHQWRQPLSVISTSASGIKFMIEHGATIDKTNIMNSTDKIVSQAKYLSKTIDDFRNFIRDDKKHIELSVSEVVTGSLNLVEAVLKDQYIKIVSDISDDILIKGNKNELQQAFINILNNAKDAINDHVKDENERYIFISTKKIDEHNLELKIMDNAGGVSEEIIKRVFEPYFTTKHKSQGTGLGLSMVDKIIRQRHDFNIEVYNEDYKYEDKEYKGAAFIISFSN